MIRFLLWAVPVVVTIYALIDIVSTPRQQTRALPKWLWLLLIVIVPFVGALAWLFLGRPPAPGAGVPPVQAAGSPTRRPSTGRRRGPVAPDDDPTFLRRLADDEWSRKMRNRRSGDEAREPDDHPDPTGR
ncbi:unannotated protein [freshwater metagenome]|uniref:Unannotated protein n=1 Tax=freshwater metagenome TaxID=449393 RepID=A0A6J7IMU5_9ZZZZ|nr:hypothetical protein [Actinomycetota bacterium]MSW36070.1 hypothetical protein [Actinomycetota bacterium]MSX38266.1 hypothetical protein [Actinomycetota bacterium]